ncbi:hypothetical protein CRM22_001074, partial [Opisthorchis felineus]
LTEGAERQYPVYQSENPLIIAIIRDSNICVDIDASLPYTHTETSNLQTPPTTTGALSMPAMPEPELHPKRCLERAGKQVIPIRVEPLRQSYRREENTKVRFLKINTLKREVYEPPFQEFSPACTSESPTGLFPSSSP